MKTLIVSAALIAASAAFAAGDSVNTFGLMKINSGTARTVVAVPWAAVDGSANISVADVVKTDNLTPKSDNYSGDKLYYYDMVSKKYESWTLGVNGWEGDTSVSGAGVEVADSTRALTRGNALVLIRKNYKENNNTGNPIPFYVFGSVPAATTSTEITAYGGGAYNVLACPNAQSTAYDVNSSTWSNVWVGQGGRSDILVLNGEGGKLLYCFYRKIAENNWKWQYSDIQQKTGDGVPPGVFETVWNDAPTMEAGTGFWYISYGTIAPRVTWVK